MTTNLVTLSLPKFDIPTAQEMRAYRTQQEEKKRLEDLKESLGAYPVFENILHTMVQNIVEKFRNGQFAANRMPPSIEIPLWIREDGTGFTLSKIYWSALDELGLDADKYDATSTMGIETRASQLDETFALFLSVVHNVNFDWMEYTQSPGLLYPSPSGYHEISSELLSELNDTRGTFEMLLADSIAQVFKDKGYTVCNNVKLVRKCYTRETAIYEKSSRLIIMA